ncbi:MAG: hypothetical protein WBA23_00020 [Tunicatimonas sp.]|uniref:hypothetical protein n=1 Tax=Tunicatimonas sp. TaxID=1940096 RepID=UPI003C779F06
MEKYPELIKAPECAEQFFNEYKGVMPEKSLIAGFNFALSCDMFHYSFNKYLLKEGNSFYRVGESIRKFFSENTDNPRRAALFSIFVNEYLTVTRDLLLNREYYELMARFDEAEEKALQTVSLQMSEINRSQSID